LGAGRYCREKKQDQIGADAHLDQEGYRRVRNYCGIHSRDAFRHINKGNRIVGVRMSEQAIYNLVMDYAVAAGVGRMAPHDLRRTFAKLAHKGGSALDQIQLSLGHASIQTTETYLGVEQDLTDAPCDRLGLRL
jgi:integrase